VRIYGRHPVLEALRSGQPVYRVYLRQGSHYPEEIYHLARERGVKLRTLPPDRFRELGGREKHQGVVAFVADFALADPDELILNTRGKGRVLVVLDGLEDPRNVGDIIRTVEFLGGAGVVLGKDRSPPLEDALTKASAGAVFHLPVAIVTNLGRFLRRFKENGGWVAAVELDGEALDAVDLPRPLALVLGSEGKGVRESLLRDVDFRITIRGEGEVNSLNVSCAAAIAVFHALRKPKGESNG
jgi:23S rRNA (guanosine2251-2'-O)-methyltransferase